MTQCLATLVTLLAFCVEGAEFSMAPRSSLCIRSACRGRCNILDTSEKVTVTLREVPRDTSSVLWQVPSLPPSSSV